MTTLFAAPRLGLVETQIAHADRHGLLWLSRATISVESGCISALCAPGGELPEGKYAIPQQTVSMLLLGPGCSVTQDALRILSRQGTAVIVVGDGGVKSYSAMPLGASRSIVARQHAYLWADPDSRLKIARRMYAMRFGEILPHRDIAVLRGIEGGRIKAAYENLAMLYGIKWAGRHYDRNNPSSADLPNQAINHIATFVESAAEIATYAVGAVPALGFIHEDSANSFVLDIADLLRTEITIPLAFTATKRCNQDSSTLERHCRHLAAEEFRKKKTISELIDRIKTLLEVSK